LYSDLEKNKMALNAQLTVEDLLYLMERRDREIANLKYKVGRLEEDNARLLESLTSALTDLSKGGHAVWTPSQEAPRASTMKPSGWHPRDGYGTACIIEAEEHKDAAAKGLMRENEDLKSKGPSTYREPGPCACGITVEVIPDFSSREVLDGWSHVPGFKDYAESKKREAAYAAEVERKHRAEEAEAVKAKRIAEEAEQEERAAAFADAERVATEAEQTKYAAELVCSGGGQTKATQQEMTEAHMALEKIKTDEDPKNMLSCLSLLPSLCKPELERLFQFAGVSADNAAAAATHFKKIVSPFEDASRKVVKISAESSKETKEMKEALRARDAEGLKLIRFLREIK